MEQLPKIVRQRLRAGGAVGEHPDPNVLTAFAEHSLVGRERARVLEHVTLCQDCREILAVATAVPAAEPAPAARGGSSSAWFRWPAVRWGAVAACCVVVGAAVLVRQDMKHTAPAVPVQKDGLARDERSVPVAAELAKPAEKRSVPAKQPERASAAKTSPPQPASATGPTAQPEAVEEDKLMAKESEGTANLNLKKTAPSGVAGGVATQVPPLQLSVPRSPAPPSASVTAHSDMVDQTATVPVQSETVQVEAGSTPVATAQSQAATTTLARRELGKAKASPMPASEPKPGTTENTLQSGEANGPPSASPAIPRWEISAEGQLRRSFDSGKTWEAVPVIDSSTLSSTVRTSTAALDRYGPARVSENKKDRQEPTAEGGQPKLHALCANGNDVWVGGAAGALYHSTDAGLHWTRVRPTAGGVTLTADIVALDFTDPQHGELTSSAGDSWVTSDGGKSWQKQ
ncbi:MAG TPA: YCF48-related protein [Terriglobales bacterium]|nr:YCF48-related protein [Terriglobales bacterium]